MNIAESLGFVPKKTTHEVRGINIKDIVPNPKNFYHIGDLTELKASILNDGVQQNLVVTPMGDGKYMIVSGHRRRQAVKELLAEGEDVDPMLPCKIETDSDAAERLLPDTNSTARVLTLWERICQTHMKGEIIARQRKEGKIKEPKREAMVKALHKSSGTIGREEAIYKNISPSGRACIQSGRITDISAAYELSKMPEGHQEAMINNAKLMELEEITLRDVQHYKAVRHLDEKEEDERQTTIIDFIEDDKEVQPEEAAEDAEETAIETAGEAPGEEAESIEDDDDNNDTVVEAKESTPPMTEQPKEDSSPEEIAWRKYKEDLEQKRRLWNAVGSEIRGLSNEYFKLKNDEQVSESAIRQHMTCRVDVLKNHLALIEELIKKTQCITTPGKQ